MQLFDTMTAMIVLPDIDLVAGSRRTCHGVAVLSQDVVFPSGTLYSCDAFSDFMHISMCSGGSHRPPCCDNSNLIS